ncbi:hypothetical protein CR970_04200 [Candidatus Saccharibacteria bacterium]|nr:MAG: hypothetical protein CR970_04200 [Candidatus Saccharibacteria bacterium]
MDRSDTAQLDDSNPNTVYMTVDHKTYSSVSELSNDSDTIVLGSVLNNGSSKQDPSPDKSGGGQPAPGLVSTEFSVRVDKSLKGDVKSGQAITVVLTGGTVNGTKYMPEDMPWLSKGESVIIYLSRGGDGKYYPLAGGAAIASKKSASSKQFVLPSGVSGGRQMEVSEVTF